MVRVPAFASDHNFSIGLNYHAGYNAVPRSGGRGPAGNKRAGKSFFAILEKVTSYEITGDVLKLAGEGGAYSLTFTRKSAEEERPFLWIVDKKQVDCRGVVHQNCLQVKKRDFDQWEILREKIGGFAYKPGRYYLLRVRHSDKGYKLVKIISRTRLMPHVD